MNLFQLLWFLLQTYTGLLRTSRSLGDGKAAVQPEVPAQAPHQIQGIYQKKPNARRREPRRHTLQNGIDYNMLKRMKQIEQEKEVKQTFVKQLLLPIKMTIFQICFRC